jgi:adenylate cyclase
LQSGVRLLASIMFTDMVGFTALMQENEEKAKAQRDRLKKVLDKKIAEHQGRILQNYGDGTLSIFGSAIESVKSAIAIQAELQNEPKIPLRIGLHMGDVVYDDDGVYGDAVNIASRIESLSVPGAVLISEKLYSEISNQPDLSAKSVGKFELKNVKQPLEVLAITTHGLTVPKPEDIDGKGKTAYRSIAVLPFLNMSADQENEYFSDGITEEIINALTKVDGLQVTSRTSSFAFKGRNEDIRSLGQKRNVSTILEGSVRKAGNSVRITAQLINAVDGFHFWSENYDGTLDNIFRLQDEISRKIANKLIDQLSIEMCGCGGSAKVTAPLVKAATTDLDAYNIFLKGLFYWNRWTKDNALEAIGYFEEAIRIEPKFAKAYAKLADCYVFLAAMGFMKSSLAYPEAEKYAAKALSIDDTCPECYISTGFVKVFYKWDWEGSRQAFEKAIELSPSNYAAYFGYSYYLIAVGEIERATEAIEKARSLDPLGVPVNLYLSMYYLRIDKCKESIELLDRLLEYDPTFRNALECKGWAYYYLGDMFTAISIAKEVHKLAGGGNRGLTTLGYYYAKSGEKEKALEIIEKLKTREKEEMDNTVLFDLALNYLGVGDKENALLYIDKFTDERNGGSIFLKIDRLWEELRDDPRFQEIIKKVGL